MAEFTQVGIVGAGPAGLVLAHLLAASGIDSVVLESRDRTYVESRVRAGVMEHSTVELLVAMGVADRLKREGLVHQGINVQFDGERNRIDLCALTGGKVITVYGQQEIVKDLIGARLADGGDIRFESAAVVVEDIDTDRPLIRYCRDGQERELRCDFVAGCDGFRGVCRPSVPEDRLTIYEHEYPFAWLGILAAAPPSTDEVIYSFHPRGFALHSMRSPTVSRLYLQVAPDASLVDWPDERIWQELQIRLGCDGWSLREGPIIDKGITPMRSFVAEPLRHGSLFLAGDAAHIVPPTGAKGMNLAVADVARLASALAAWYRTGDTSGLDAYSDWCLERAWRAQDLSTMLTNLLHVDPDADAFSRRLQRSRQKYLVHSRAMATALAENYVGLPLDWSS